MSPVSMLTHWICPTVTPASRAMASSTAPSFRPIRRSPASSLTTYLASRGAASRSRSVTSSTLRFVPDVAGQRFQKRGDLGQSQDGREGGLRRGGEGFQSDIARVARGRPDAPRTCVSSAPVTARIAASRAAPPTLVVRWSRRGKAYPAK